MHWKVNKITQVFIIVMQLSSNLAVETVRFATYVIMTGREFEFGNALFDIDPT